LAHGHFEPQAPAAIAIKLAAQQKAARLHEITTAAALASQAMALRSQNPRPLERQKGQDGHTHLQYVNIMPLLTQFQ
jgi:hypothetical protein